MASQNTILTFFPFDYEAPYSGYALASARPFNRNGHPCLLFDTTTQQGAVFTSVMPRNYSNSGIMPIVHFAATGVTGTVGWILDFERISNDFQNSEVDGFAEATTLASVNVPSNMGYIAFNSGIITAATGIDNVVAGDIFRLRIKRDVTNDSYAANAELHAIELMEV